MMQRSNRQPAIAVLMGGVNSEAQVSLESGARILAALERMGYRAEALVHEDDLQVSISALSRFDLVFNALHGGDGEDGTVQAALEQARIPFTGSGSKASWLAMDKHISKEQMLLADVPTPAWLKLESGSVSARIHWQAIPELPAFVEEHSLPLVVKPNHEGSTVGLTIVESPGDLDQAILLAREFGPDVLVEAYIPGRELTATILDEVPLPIVEIVAEGGLYDYESKYSDGLSTYFVPADLPLETTVAIQGAAARLYQQLGVRHYARVDFRLNPAGEFYCLELNTLPGMTSHSLTPMAAAAVNIDFDGLVEQIVQLAWRDRAAR